MSGPDEQDPPHEQEQGRDQTTVPLADMASERAALRAFAEAVLACPDDEDLPPEVFQLGFSALTKIYGVRYQMGERFWPFDAPRAMPPTIVMIMASQMLRAAKLEIFELSMWQMWSGN